MLKNFFLFISFFAIVNWSFGQRVTVSEDINVRTDYLFDIMGKVDNKILLFRDKGLDHTLQVYDDDLWHKEDIDLDFERRRIDPVGIVTQDKSFNLFYTFRRKGDQILACRKFDASGMLLDTSYITQNNAILNFQKYYFAFSKDKKYVAIFNFEREVGMKVHVFDNEKMTPVWENEYLFGFPFVRRDFREIIVTDQGGCFLIFEKDNFRLGKPDTYIDAFYLNQFNGDLTKQMFSFGNKYVVDYMVDYDNINNKLIISGLFGDRYRSRADGFFYLQEGFFVFNYFKPELFAELEKNSKRKVNNLEDYIIADMVLRADGGVILLAEMQREFSRRSNLAEGRRQSFSLNAYVDYYNEDIVALAINPDGMEHWNQVLRKKQFSQDDGAFYSSFFVFKSPTELRIIFNDEIKQDNTVSEYIINPIGENERHIVMNTEYQKLKLRFVDAIQISTREFIVPSERNSKFNLVKVTF